MKALFDKVSSRCSMLVTRSYSTSFSLGIYCLNTKLHEPIYNIYGFVRLADEIVDSFHEFNRTELLKKFENETFKAIAEKISLNPILNSFQATVNQYNIENELIKTFLKSMEMDLTEKTHDISSFQDYVLGSAEVVGLMCLRVFCDGDENRYQNLKKSAMCLGSAFQKVNFLRDLHADYYDLSRTYFPGMDVLNFTPEQKKKIEADIKNDFNVSLDGIKQLPKAARLGVYVAYVYYQALLKKIEATSIKNLLNERLRISNYRKFSLLVHSYVRYNLGL